MSLILPYAVLPAMYVEYDPAAPAVAARVKTIIEAASPTTLVEHIGSTAVPGCAGKGIVDLAAFYSDGAFEATRDAIDGAGFQPQKSGHAFPQHRPMRVLGAIEHEGVRSIACTCTWSPRHPTRRHRCGNSAMCCARTRRCAMRIKPRSASFSSPAPAIRQTTLLPKASSSAPSSTAGRASDEAPGCASAYRANARTANVASRCCRKALRKSCNNGSSGAGPVETGAGEARGFRRCGISREAGAQIVAPTPQPTYSPARHGGQGQGTAALRTAVLPDVRRHHHLRVCPPRRAMQRPVQCRARPRECDASRYETVRDAAGGMPLLAPMSQIAGRLAPLIAASLLLSDRGGSGVLLPAMRRSHPPDVSPSSAPVRAGSAATSGGRAAWALMSACSHAPTIVCRRCAQCTATGFPRSSTTRNVWPPALRRRM